MKCVFSSVFMNFSTFPRVFLVSPDFLGVCRVFYDIDVLFELIRAIFSLDAAMIRLFAPNDFIVYDC